MTHLDDSIAVREHPEPVLRLPRTHKLVADIRDLVSMHCVDMDTDEAHKIRELASSDLHRQLAVVVVVLRLSGFGRWDECGRSIRLRAAPRASSARSYFVAATSVAG